MVNNNVIGVDDGEDGVIDECAISLLFVTGAVNLPGSRDNAIGMHEPLMTDPGLPFHDIPPAVIVNA